MSAERSDNIEEPVPPRSPWHESVAAVFIVALVVVLCTVPAWGAALIVWVMGR